MFEKYGEFCSHEEINEMAAEFLKAGKEKELLELAQENGIDKEDAEDYFDGFTDCLCTASMAAAGKLKVEAEELNIAGILTDWKDAILDMCMTDVQMQLAVRKKDKSLKECMAGLIRFAFENKVQISNKIVDITKVTVNGKTEAMRKPLYLGIPNKAEVKRIVTEYYLK